MKRFYSIFLLVIVVLLLINQVFLGLLFFTVSSKAKQANHYEMMMQQANEIAVLKDVPWYGKNLNLSFATPQDTDRSNEILGKLAPFQGDTPIELNEDELKRYIAIGTEPLITCEFCCGVRVLVFPDGKPSCGCAHSQAMRGTVAYILKNFPEKTNAEISYELVRQKGMFFPESMTDRLIGQLATAQYSNDIQYLVDKLSEERKKELSNLAKSLDTGVLNQKKKAGMVGKC
jgi:hypothetical protein